MTRAGWATASVVAVGVVAVGVAGYILARTGPDEPEPEVEPPNEEAAAAEPDELLRMPLTGVVTDAVPARPALVVKVSNSPEARPQSGLDAADLVYEEVTEGGITRFIAVFHSQLPEVVGPVRSARPVDIQVMSGFGHPGFAYSGARDEVQQLLATAPAVTITEGAPGFFRDHGEYASHPVAPHNLFLQVDETLSAVIEQGAEVLGDLGWAFDDDPPDGSDPDGGDTLTVAMSEAFVTTWSYDTGAGVYRRQQNLVDTTVTGPGRVGAANVVVLDVRHYVGPSGYPETDVLGQGEAVVYRDGRRYAARWTKPAATDPLAILTADGDPFPLKPGPTWLHLPDELPPAG